MVTKNGLMHGWIDGMKNEITDMLNLCLVLSCCSNWAKAANNLNPVTKFEMWILIHLFCKYENPNQV